MAIDVDGFDILRSIGDNPQIFSDIAAEINKTARAFVTKQLKAKSSDLARVRAVYGCIGGEAFTLILDGFTAPATTALAKKLDKEHPEIASASSEWRRNRIEELARGAAEPASKAPKKVRGATKAEPKEKIIKSPQISKPKVKRALSSKALAARWDRKNRDD
jgi:hypothetical protein